jgi:hypothetical protein
VTALVLLAAATFLLVSLATFDAADPPAPHAFPPNARALNACGAVGSFLAGQAYRWLGLASWLGLLLVAVLDVALLRRRVLPDLPLRTVGAVIATVGAATLLAMFLPDSLPRPVWGPGGAIGATGRMFAEGLLAHTGAAIVVSGITAAGLFLACDTLLARLAAVVAPVGGALVGGPGRPPARTTTIAPRPAHRRQLRRDGVSRMKFDPFRLVSTTPPQVRVLSGGEPRRRRFYELR